MKKKSPWALHLDASHIVQTYSSEASIAGYIGTPSKETPTAPAKGNPFPGQPLFLFLL